MSDAIEAAVDAAWLERESIGPSTKGEWRQAVCSIEHAIALHPRMIDYALQSLRFAISYPVTLAKQIRIPPRLDAKIG